MSEPPPGTSEVHRWYGRLDYLLAPMGCLLAPIWMPMIAIIGPLLEHRTKKQIEQRERAFAGQLEGSSRLVEWPDVLLRLSRREGTLIIEGEIAAKSPVRTWWIPTDLRASLGEQVPRDVEDPRIDTAACLEIASRIRRDYLDPASGCALLARLPTLEHRRALAEVPPGSPVFSVFRLADGRFRITAGDLRAALGGPSSADAAT